MSDLLDVPTTLDPERKAKAEHALAALVDTGDLDRLVALARAVGGAQDALSDDIVGRLAATIADGLDLLDRVNRSGVARALPAVSALVDTGDLDRLVALARVVGNAQDALSDDIVGRLGQLVSDAISVLDRVTRSGIIDELLELAATLQIFSRVGDLLASIAAATAEETRTEPAKGGLGGLWAIIKERQNQEALRFLLAVGRHLRRS